MRLEAIQFFQPVMVEPKDGKRPMLITSARHTDFDLELQNDRVRVQYRGHSKSTYSTLANTCWYIPLEVTNEPNTSESAPARADEKTSKRRPVVKHKLPATDGVHTGSSEA